MSELQPESWKRKKEKKPLKGNAIDSLPRQCPLNRDFSSLLLHMLHYWSHWVTAVFTQSPSQLHCCLLMTEAAPMEIHQSLSALRFLNAWDNWSSLATKGILAFFLLYFVQIKTKTKVWAEVEQTSFTCILYTKWHRSEESLILCEKYF